MDFDISDSNHWGKIIEFWYSNSSAAKIKQMNTVILEDV